MTGLAILLGIGLVILWVASVVYVAWMLTHPPRRTYASAVARGRPGDPSELVPARVFETWRLHSRRRDLPVWDLSGDDPAGPVVILTHGWADSRIGGLLRVSAIAPHASRLILWDLPGHGEAPGVCALGTREVGDLEALIEVVRGKRDKETERRRDEEQSPERERRGGVPPIVLYGWSLGAGASIVAAARDPSIAAVIAESPYRVPPTPARNVLRARALPHRANLMPAMGLAGTVLGVGPGFRGFDRAAHAAQLGCPLLVIHGADDEVCPIEDGRAIAGAAPHGSIAEIPGARHNDLWTEPAHAARCAAAIARFLAGFRAQ